MLEKGYWEREVKCDFLVSLCNPLINVIIFIPSTYYLYFPGEQVQNFGKKLCHYHI